jgi:putative DNA primase/helicase
VTAFDRVPDELRTRAQWVGWRREGRDEEPTKVPYSLTRGGRASSTEATTWGTFDDAVLCMTTNEFDGIGYVLAEDDPHAGVDLDDCLEDGRLHPAAASIVMQLDSFCEISPSGNGVKLIVRGSKNGTTRCSTTKTPWGGKFECYDRARFWTITGNNLTGTPLEIAERQAELDAVLAEYLPTIVIDHDADRSASTVDLDDQELLEIALQDEKFRRLYVDGDTSEYGGDDSAADLGLCNKIVFYFGRDFGRIDRIFRSSALVRLKWERQDYREWTITKAIERTSEGYQPRHSERSRGSDAVDAVGASKGVVGSSGVAESVLKDSATPEAPPLPVDEAETSHFSDSDAVDSVVESERPFALPIREFVALERGHHEPMLADAEGRAVVGFLSLVLLGALGGHGKTTWAIDLFLHMAAGVDFPPFAIPRPVSILVVENEGPEQMFADKLEARLQHFAHKLKAPLDVCVFDWGGFSLADETHRDRLIREIAERKYDLVFGDPLDSLGIEGVGSPEDTRKFLALMKKTGLNKSVAWWLNTHPRKEETKEALNEIAGAWGGKPDTVFLLRMLEGDRTQLRQPKLRWARRGKGPTLLFAFDPETEAFSFIGEQSEEERDHLAELRGLLADGEWRTVKEIAAPVEAGGIGMNEKIVKRVLDEHPDVFESRTGDEAKALGRSPQATLWQLRGEDDK